MDTVLVQELARVESCTWGLRKLVEERLRLVKEGSFDEATLLQDPIKTAHVNMLKAIRKAESAKKQKQPEGSRKTM